MYVSLKIVLHGPKHVACSEQMRTANYYEVYFYILSPVWQNANIIWLWNH